MRVATSQSVSTKQFIWINSSSLIYLSFFLDLLTTRPSVLLLFKRLIIHSETPSFHVVTKRKLICRLDCVCSSRRAGVKANVLHRWSWWWLSSAFTKLNKNVSINEMLLKLILRNQTFFLLFASIRQTLMWIFQFDKCILELELIIKHLPRVSWFWTEKQSRSSQPEPIQPHLRRFPFHVILVCKSHFITDCLSTVARALTSKREMIALEKLKGLQNNRKT